MFPRVFQVFSGVFQCAPAVLIGVLGCASGGCQDFVRDFLGSISGVVQRCFEGVSGVVTGVFMECFLL